jgi:hypothetical protein
MTRLSEYMKLLSEYMTRLSEYFRIMKYKMVQVNGSQNIYYSISTSLGLINHVQEYILMLNKIHMLITIIEIDEGYKMSSCGINCFVDDVLEDRNIYKSLTVFHECLSCWLRCLRQLYFTVKIYYRMKCKFPTCMYNRPIITQDLTWKTFISSYTERRT